MPTKSRATIAKIPNRPEPSMFALSQEALYEEEIKKSRFIVKAAGVLSSEAAMAFLEKVREAKATHNCWAYRIGQKYRFSDDGEPGGTAGRPILNAIEKQDIDGVMVVVVRYFGGIKLGAGGLARAYGGCAARCLQQAKLKRIVPQAQVHLQVGFDHIGALYAIIDQFGAAKLAETYTDSGLDIRLQMDRAKRQALVTALTDASGGSIRLLEG
jgi:uncharacterized YigZ family protein